MTKGMLGEALLTLEWCTSLSHDDRLQLIDLMNTVSVRETTLGFYEVISVEDGLGIMNGLAADVARKAVHLLLGRTTEGTIMGMLVLAKQALPARSHIVEMKRCVIDPRHRGRFVLQGWELALEKCREIGCDMIVIDVREDGKAERLWRRLGFKEYGKLPDYARVRGRIITGYFLYAYVDDVLRHKQAAGTFWYQEKGRDA